MNKYINPNVVLPTTDIFTEDTLKQSIWAGFSESTTSQEFVTAGYVLVQDTTETQNEGDVLVADKDQSGNVVASWMSQADYTVIVNNRLAGAVARAKRNKLLAECDWTQAKDVPDLTSSKWTEYRQALRDITSQEGFPTNINWPQSPSGK